ncbi:hypothetical protein [Roseospira visakhapatnamensis]|uniref:Uncharacterized protein n=1 Tax=Roseospira visakhapatnamensis TaxID=390880 RepID=A0A7W6RG45_9PROT|nr:hypothetical protein [Roseospira visakhapatnamensis]MBB4267705.1 hypothetical protein [Roseospira visakhapatnamensis]
MPPMILLVPDIPVLSVPHALRRLVHTLALRWYDGRGQRLERRAEALQRRADAVYARGGRHWQALNPDT